MLTSSAKKCEVYILGGGREFWAGKIKIETNVKKSLLW